MNFPASLDIQECIGLAEFIARFRFPTVAFAEDFLIEAAVETYLSVSKVNQEVMREHAEYDRLSFKRQKMVSPSKFPSEEDLVKRFDDGIERRLRAKAAELTRVVQRVGIAVN